MKTKITKALALTLCAVLLVVGSVMGTVAYLTATATVQNTFTYGNVVISLAENDIDGDSDTTRNTYKLIPGQTYVKNTTIHVAAGSEACYLFVRVDPNFKSIDNNFALATGWNELSGVDNVYYYATTGENDAIKYGVETSSAIQDILVLGSFTVRTDGSLESYAGANIVAYAVQKSGFTDAKAAWDNTFGAPAQNNG